MDTFTKPHHNSGYLMITTETNVDDDDNVVSLAIIRERNQELLEIAQETSMLSEIMSALSEMLHGQGERLDLVETQVENAVVHIEEAAEHLAHASDWKTKTRLLLLDVSTIVAGTGAGCLGFIGGPWIGVPLVLGGIVASSSIVVARRRYQSLGHKDT